MTRAAGLLLALLLLAPAAQAQPATSYPDALLALLPGWIEEAQREGSTPNGSPVAPEAARYLDEARNASREGRFRVAVFHLDTHHQLVETRRLLDEARAGNASLARQKDFILARTAAWHGAAMDDWRAFRQDLHALDGRLKSLRALELALYAADFGLVAALQATEAKDMRAAFVLSEDLDENGVAGLVRTSAGVSRQLAFASGLLRAASAAEGLPPRLDAAAWNATVQEAGAPLEDPTLDHAAGLEAIAGDARGRGEGILLVALQLAHVRQARVAGILQQLGDGAARGQDVVGDASKALRRALDQVDLATGRDAGLQNVFAADATDRARYALALADAGAVGVGTLAYAWAGLDHQWAAGVVLKDVSAQAPPGSQTPLSAGLAIAALGAALLMRRRA